MTGSAPTPQAMTLTLAALLEAAEYTYGLVKATGAYYSQDAEDALARAKAGIEALSDEATERDDTAELVEALEWLDEQLSEVQRSLRAPVKPAVLLKATEMSVPRLQGRVRDALAKWKERNGE